MPMIVGPLTLPTLGPEVPKQLNIWENESLTAYLAEALLDAGYLKWTGHLANDTEKALKAWADKLLPNVIGPTIGITDDCTDHLHLPSARPLVDVLAKRKPAGIFIRGMGDYPDFYTIKEETLRFNGLMPRLGSTICSILEAKLDASLGCSGPNKSLYTAQSHHWQGEEDEMQWVLENMEYYHEQGECPAPTPENIKQFCEENNVFTRAEFDSEIPKEIYASKNLTYRELIKAANQIGGKDGETIRLAAEVSRFKFEDNIEDSYYRADSILLYWEPWGVVGKLYDDKMEDMMNSGEGHDVTYLHPFDPLDPKQTKAAMKHMEAFIQKTSKILELLKAFATRIKRN